MEIVLKACRELGISYLTLYALSVENLKRPRAEVKALMNLLREYLDNQAPMLIDEGIRLRVIGNPDLLPKDLALKIETVVRKTKAGKSGNLTLALAYGGRDEILRAASKLINSAGKKEVSVEQFEKCLDTAGLPDPDLIIRTGGERRLSNFLTWQSVYAELLFTNTLWPDFRRKHLTRAIIDYQARQRRYGLTGKQAERSKKSMPQTSRG